VGAELLFDVINAAYKRTSTIVTGLLPKNWIKFGERNPAKSMIFPNGMADDIRRESMSVIVGSIGCY
jgi:hypothetical protein